MSPRATRSILFAILALYLIVGAQYAALTPAWQVPDEPAHYNYIRRIAATGRLPVLQAGDYDQTYLSELTSTGFPPTLPIDSLLYESHQPPGYYLLLTPLFLLSGGNLLALRLFSLLLGAGVIIFTYRAARELFADDPNLALTAAGFAAFVPQHVAMMAGVNNDSLAELLIGLALFLALRLLGSGISAGGLEIGVGVVVGLAFLTKTTAYIVAPVVAAALLLKARNSQLAICTLAQTASFVFIPAFALGAVWWGRNLLAYGWPDFLGLARHSAIVVGQPRTAEWIAKLGAVGFAKAFAVTTFRSFWGQFGWMGVVMDERVYLALGGFSALIIAGLTARILTRSRSHLLRHQRHGIGLLILSLLLTLALYLYYNLTFVQHQGRYLFPALIPIAIGAAAGLTSLARAGAAVWDRDSPTGADEAKDAKRPDCASSRAIFDWLPLVVVLLMAALDLFALYRYIIPALPRY